MSGSEFQTNGAATENACRAMSVLVLEFTMLSVRAQVETLLEFVAIAAVNWSDIVSLMPEIIPISINSLQKYRYLPLHQYCCFFKFCSTTNLSGVFQVPEITLFGIFGVEFLRRIPSVHPVTSVETEKYSISNS